MAERIEAVEKLSQERHCELAACYLRAAGAVLLSLYRSPAADIDICVTVLEEALAHVENQYGDRTRWKQGAETSGGLLTS